MPGGRGRSKSERIADWGLTDAQRSLRRELEASNDEDRIYAELRRELDATAPDDCDPRDWHLWLWGLSGVAAKRIAQIDSPRSVEILSELASDSNRVARRATANAMIHVTANEDQILPLLMTALADEDPDIRRPAAWTLAVGRKASVAELPLERVLAVEEVARALEDDDHYESGDGDEQDECSDRRLLLPRHRRKRRQPSVLCHSLRRSDRASEHRSAGILRYPPC